MVLGLLFLIILLLIAEHLVEIAQDSPHAPTFQNWSVYGNERVGRMDSVRTKVLSAFPLSDAGCRQDGCLAFATATDEDTLGFLLPFYHATFGIKENTNRSANRSAVALAQRNNQSFLHRATGTFSKASDLEYAVFAESHSTSVRQLIQPDEALTPRSILENRIRKKVEVYA